MRKVLFVVALVATGALTGCSQNATTSSAANASPSATAPSSAPPLPSPSPTPTYTVDQLTGWVDHAGLSAGALGGARGVSEKGTREPGVGCPDQAQSTGTIVAGRYWRWAGGTFKYVEHDVIAYADLSGKDVVGEVKGFANACQQYNLQDSGGTYIVLMAGEYALPQPAGVDASFAWCELSTVQTPAAYKGHQTMFCTAFFSRGPVVMRIHVYGDKPTAAAGQQKLSALAALAVPAFVAAVPAA